MLTSADRALVGRDTALPGLALLLDPPAFVTELARWLPEWETARGQITYLRYKPGQSCLVGYRLELDGKHHCWHAKAHRVWAQDRAQEKLEKHREFFARRSIDGRDFLILDERGLAIGRFPQDRKLKPLARVEKATRRQKLLAAALSNIPSLWVSQLEPLRYKPERRYVARLHGEGGTQALLKVCTADDFDQTLAGNRAFRSQGRLQVSRVLGWDARRHLLIGEWVRGQPLDRLLRYACPNLENVGAALMALHRQRPEELAQRSRCREVEELRQTTDDLGELCPELRARLDDLTNRLTARLGELTETCRPIHGDLHVEQVLLDGENVALIDFDQACYGDPMADLGSFIAHLDCLVIENRLDQTRRDDLRATLLKGYRQAGGKADARHVALYTAYGLLLRCLEPFRQRWKNWPIQTARLLERAEAELAAATGAATSEPGSAVDASATPCLTKAPDEVLNKALNEAMDSDVMRPLLATLCDRKRETPPILDSVTLLRHKPGRRALIEYRFAGDTSPDTPRPWLGKLRAKGLDKRSFELQRKLHASGFDENSPDGISVPRPVGMLPELRMWLQEKVPGDTLTDRWQSPQSVPLARRVSEAIHRLHRAPVTPYSTHTIDDELAILRRRLTEVAEQNAWRSRILAVLSGCERIAETLVPSSPCGIHRDFYPDQLLAHGERLYLLDLDLYCLGDPALDVGNFIAHMMEYALRTQGDIHAFDAPQRALAAHFLTLSPTIEDTTLQGYITLSLARHIHISTQFADRTHCTRPLIEHCEERLERHHV